MVEVASGSVPPNKLGLILLSVVGTTLGLLPYLLFMQWTRYLPFAAVAAGVIAGLTLLNFRSQATYTPTLGEWLLAAWSALAYTPVASVEGLFFYGLVYWAIPLLTFIIEGFGWRVTLDASAIATVISALVSIPVSGFFAGMAPREIGLKLYPDTPGTRSLFFPLATQAKIPILVAAATALGFIGAFAFLDRSGLPFIISILLMLLYTSLPLAKIGSKEKVSERGMDARNAIRKLLEAADYEVKSSYGTADAESAPLLKSVDYLARRDNQALVVETKVFDDTSSLGWEAASALRTAAGLVKDGLRSAEGREVAVWPLLILIGGKPSEGIKAFSSHEGVTLTHITDLDTLLHAVGTQDGEALRKQAAELLHLQNFAGSSSRAGNSQRSM